MEELIKEIKAIIKPDPKYVEFYKTAIIKLGRDRVRGFLKDIELDSKEGRVIDKAHLFTAFISEAMDREKSSFKTGNAYLPFKNITDLTDELKKK